MIFMLKVAGPILVLAMLTGLVTNLMQTKGFIFSTEKLKFDIKKIQPTPQKFFEKIMFSPEVMFNFFKSIMKLVIILVVAYTVLSDKLGDFLQMIELTPYDSITFLSKVIFEIIIKVLICMIIFSYADFRFQKYRFMDKMKMTKQEVKDEMKQMEGDPLIKGKIREKQMQARRRMMQEIPKADVIIRNPTHYAVALKYVREEMTAPTVVAKGAGYLALKIIQIGEENGVPVVTDKPLARTLFTQVEVGDEIPVELYKSISEIITYVWKLKGKVF
jgi:flagellar biosynthetic protein FlhB